MKKNLFRVMIVAWMLLVSCGQKATNTGTGNQTASAGEHETGLKKKASATVQHFWFEYKAQPDPGKRVWVHVDDST
jgi:major membrane immunogen (membrane-anchored lipoprotein)